MDAKEIAEKVMEGGPSCWPGDYDIQTLAQAYLDLLSRSEVSVPVEQKYNELIMAVASKFPGESRHETALRYIEQAEKSCNGPDKAAHTNKEE